MERYITLGADESGEVYGLELDGDGRWRRNPLGFFTSCVVARPVSKATYEYMTEDPQSAKEIWKQCVAAGETEKGLAQWFDDYVSDDYVSDDSPLDTSFVFELLDDNDNPTVAEWHDDRVADGDHEFESFRRYVEAELVRSSKVTAVESADDVWEWEASGFFPPKKPFAVEFAPKGLLEEYYAHLRKTCKEFKG